MGSVDTAAFVSKGAHENGRSEGNHTNHPERYAHVSHVSNSALYVYRLFNSASRNCFFPATTMALLALSKRMIFT